MKNNSAKPGKLLFEELDINLDKVPITHLHYYIAVKYFLTIQDDPSCEATNLEKLLRYLESFYHLCDAEDWFLARKIFLISSDRPDSPDNKYLVTQLSSWGYHQEVIELCQRLLFNLEKNFDVCLLRTIGDAFCSLANYQKAIEYYNSSLELEKQLSRSDINHSILNSLGVVYFKIGNFEKAISYYQKFYHSEHRYAAIFNLASAYLLMGDYKQAENYLQESLQIAKTGEQIEFLANISQSMGILYRRQGKYQQALECFKKGSEFFEIIGDPFTQGQCLGNLGNVYCDLEQYEQAINIQQKRLSIARKVKDLAGEGLTLNNLATNYIMQTHYDEAIKCLTDGLAISRKISCTESGVLEVSILSNTGIALMKLRHHSEAIRFLKQGLKISQENNYSYWEHHLLANLGDVYDAMDEYGIAFDYYCQALKLTKNMEDYKAEEEILIRLSNPNYLLDFITYIMKEHKSEDNIFLELGKISCALGDYEKAIQINNLHYFFTVMSKKLLTMADK
ncbi:MAG: tetratricopeptide repeat protein [Cyanosarcina radialis HA8281-LM2]|jgi:tetratricopeptide (TPR) repeat protein|nr:tetratricopeptide repeat protein [Cyanosarcina radialis HA8281-LM2]